MRKLLLPGLFMFFFLLLLTARVPAQFFKIYGYMTPDAREKELVYWYSFIPSSDNSYDYFNKSVERQGLMAHSLEMEYGITNNFGVALYADFEQPRNESFRYIRTKTVMAYYRLLEKSVLPVDLAIYLEYKLPRKNYGTSEEMEFKLILEKDLGFHQCVLNPTFEKKISGGDVVEGVEFAFSGGYYYRGSLVFQPGLEFYTKMGELYDIESPGNRTNYLFPCFDLVFGRYRQFIWHAGVGIGLTDPADNLIITSILSWGFF